MPDESSIVALKVVVSPEARALVDPERTIWEAGSVPPLDSICTATSLAVLLTALPTATREPTATAAISASSRAYSTRVAPRSCACRVTSLETSRNPAGPPTYLGEHLVRSLPMVEGCAPDQIKHSRNGEFPAPKGAGN